MRRDRQAKAGSTDRSGRHGPRVALLGLCAVLIGCGGLRPYYSGFYLDTPPLVETDRSAMVVYLDAMVRSEKLKRLTIAVPGGNVQSVYPRDESSPPTIDWLPLPILFAASYILSPKLKGLEVDLLVATEADGFTPVSAIQEIDGRIHIQMGSPRKSLLPSGVQLPAALFPTRFGTGPVRQDDRPWDPLELHALEQALTLLSPEELSLLSGLEFVRKQQTDKPPKRRAAHKIWGQYLGNDGEQPPRQIFLYDTPHGHDTALFIGDPSQPYPIATMCFLHEIGHAIADFARVRGYQRWNQFVARRNRLVEEWNRLIDANQLQGEKKDALRSQLDQMKNERDTLEPWFRQLDADYDRDMGPVHTAFQRVRGRAPGPTEYGGEALPESFAESFALFRADGAALRRIYPDVYDWFSAGGHLQALRESLGDLPTPTAVSTPVQSGAGSQVR